MKKSGFQIERKFVIPCIGILPYAIFKICNTLFLMDAHSQSVWIHCCFQGSPSTSLTAPKTPLASVDALWTQDKDDRKEEMSKDIGETGGSESDESEADDSDSQDSDGDGDSGDSETANGSVSDSEVSELLSARMYMQSWIYCVVWVLIILLEN